MAKGILITKENSIEIKAKKLSDYCKDYSRNKGSNITTLLARNGYSSSIISNSTRTYWLRHDGKGKSVGDFSKANGYSAFADGLCNGILRKEDFLKICKIFEIKNPNDYILGSEKEKEKPKAKAPSEYAIECHLKDIKELLKAQNLLLNKLVKMLE